jgi:hypothetical protein
LLNGALQRFDGSGFRDAGNDRFLLHDNLPSIRMARNKDHRNPAFGNNLGRRQAIDDWHVEVDECDIDLVVVTLLDQFFAIAHGTNNFMTETLEQPHECLTNVGLVLGNGDPDGQ